MADYVTAVRTADGDKLIDYNALANRPNIASDALLDDEGNANPLREHAENHALGGYDYIEPNSIGAAKIPVMLKITLPLTDPGWTEQTDEETGETYYTQDATVAGVDADVNTQWISVSPVPETEDAYNNAKVTATQQSENTITFTANSIPKIDETECSVLVYVVIQDVDMQEGVTDDAS